MWCLQSAAGESAVERIWDVGIVAPANSLLRYSQYSGEGADVDASWQAQGNDTETCSDIVSWL